MGAADGELGRRWFAHRFTGGPPPELSPRTGGSHAAHQRREWLRHLSAWATGAALLGMGVLIVGDVDRTWALLNVAALWTLVLAIDFVISFSYTIRRGRDLNPREACTSNGFRDRPVRPLRHPS